jgi:hypothetical protein
METRGGARKTKSPTSPRFLPLFRFPQNSVTSCLWPTVSLLILHTTKMATAININDARLQKMQTGAQIPHLRIRRAQLRRYSL